MEPAPDVGLQAERTAMAWQRTALAVGAVSALMAHGAQGSAFTAAAAVAGLMIAFALLVFGERRYSRTVSQVEAGRSPLALRTVRLLAAGVVGLSASAFVLVLIVGK